jgi:protoporphyrinogen oxidase
MRTTIAMDDQTLTYMLGYIKTHMWATAIRNNEVSKSTALNLLEMQDNAYGSGIKAEVEELLTMSKEDFTEHMKIVRKQEKAQG